MTTKTELTKALHTLLSNGIALDTSDWHAPITCRTFSAPYPHDDQIGGVIIRRGDRGQILGSPSIADAAKTLAAAAMSKTYAVPRASVVSMDDARLLCPDALATLEDCRAEINGIDLTEDMRKHGVVDADTMEILDLSGDAEIPRHALVNNAVLTITAIGHEAFKPRNINEKLLETVTIPDSVTGIKRGAFSFCPCLRAVDLPESLLVIGDGAFEHCESLEAIDLPNGLEAIGDSAFHNCCEMSDITIPDSVRSVGPAAFSDCSSLRTASLSNGMTSIPPSCFGECASLTSVVIPDSIKSIGGGAFWDCYSLETLHIPDSVERIGSEAFFCCINLNSLVVPDSVTDIAADAFVGCQRLSRLSLPRSLMGANLDLSDCPMAEVTYRSEKPPVTIESVTSGPRPIAHPRECPAIQKEDR